MGLTAKLQLRQSQSLVMTPQLMQSIKLLQLTHMELDRFRRRGDRAQSSARPRRGTPRRRHAEPVAEAGGAGRGAAAEGDWFETNGAWTSEAISRKSSDSSLENIFPDDPGTAERIEPDLSRPAMEVCGRRYFVRRLLRQLRHGRHGCCCALTMRDHVGGADRLCLFLDPAARLIARELAENLDDDGYMRADTGEIAARLGRPARTKSPQRCPSARRSSRSGFSHATSPNAWRCSLPSAKGSTQRCRPCSGNLDLLARRDFASLKRICGVEEDDLLDMLAEIRALDPRPGTRFTGGNTDAIVADVEVTAAGDGELGGRAQSRDACPGFWSTTSISRRFPDGPRTRPRRISCPNACRMPTG